MNGEEVKLFKLLTDSNNNKKKKKKKLPANLIVFNEEILKYVCPQPHGTANNNG